VAEDPVAETEPEAAEAEEAAVEEPETKKGKEAEES